MIDLETLIVEKDEQKTNDVLFDKDFGVSFKLLHLEKTELQQMIGQHTKMGWNKKHQQVEETDNEALTTDLLKKCVKGWKGVTYKWLATRMLLDRTKIQNMDEEIEFNQKNLLFITKRTTGIDAWIIEAIRESTNFTQQQIIETKN